MLLTLNRPRMLVPFDASETAERVLRAACHASLTERAPLVVLCVVPIPPGRAADETPPDLQDLVMDALVRAQRICREEGVTAMFEETYALDLTDEIIRVADQMRAAVIALPLDDDPPGDTLLMSPTVQQVLARAHCTVLLDPR